jgi:hypothetical protein
MKLCLMLTSLALSAGITFCAEKSPQSIALKRELFFALDKDRQIIEYGCRNMEFLISPQEFLGKVITEAVPLDDVSKEAINNGLVKAVENPGWIQSVNYTLFDHKFVAAIRYGNDQYRIKVKPNTEN